MLSSPRNILLNPTMLATVDLSRIVDQKHLSPTDRDIPPYPGFVKGSNNLTTSVTLVTAGTVFMRLDFEPELFVPVVKSEIDDTISFFFAVFG